MVHFLLSSFTADHLAFKVSYMTHKEKWSINAIADHVCLGGRQTKERDFVSHYKCQCNNILNGSTGEKVIEHL